MSLSPQQLKQMYTEAYRNGYAGRPMPYRITFCLDLFNGPQNRPLSLRALSIMLRTLLEIDIDYLKQYPNTPLIYQSGVIYMEEPPGQEDWQDIPTSLRLGILDCEDCACWRAAELVVRYGIQAKPVFLEQKRKDGSTLFHIVVLWPKDAVLQFKPQVAWNNQVGGYIEDPSAILGMR